MTALGWIILIVVLAALVVALAAWFYERATNEVALVRTGIGGRKVVLDGGTLAIPHFHEIARVNMQTIRMRVTQTGESSLITNDRLRIDVGAEFYASVVPEAAAVVRAAQTLGKRTFQPEQLTALIDGMMVDALRAAAAQKTMDELHEDRAGFVRTVREMLTDTLAKYGLQLDSVSLTALDQTPFSALDENNAFNAVGMRKLAEVIARSKKERAEIEGESQVSVRRAEVEANRRTLEIELEQRRAEIAQTQEVETLLAAQLTEVARRKAEAERQAAQARIQMEREIEAEGIAKTRAIREAEIAREEALSIAEQGRQIRIAAKALEGSAAEAEATAARRAVVAAETELETLRQTGEAERRRTLALIAAEQDAEAEARRTRIAAATAQEVAEARRIAQEEEAAAMKAMHLAEAEGERARIEAGNARSEAAFALETERRRLEALPEIVAQMVKPAEKIKGISINHISGLERRGDGQGPASPVAQTLDSILDVAIGLPALKRVGESVGLNLQDLADAPTNGRPKE
jgi:uncharacterized membrane protein YqiK